MVGRGNPNPNRGSFSHTDRLSKPSFHFERNDPGEVIATLSANLFLRPAGFCEQTLRKFVNRSPRSLIYPPHRIIWNPHESFAVSLPPNRLATLTRIKPFLDVECETQRCFSQQTLGQKFHVRDLQTPRNEQTHQTERNEICSPIRLFVQRLLVFLWEGNLCSNSHLKFTQSFKNSSRSASADARACAVQRGGRSARTSRARSARTTCGTA